MKKDATGSYIWGYHDETPSERKLAAALKKAGLKYGREVPVKGFTVDFLLDEWLVVEVDGESHLVSGRAQKDAARQRALEAAGFTVIRIPASGLSADHEIKRWVNEIKSRVDAGPPYLTNQRFENRDYKRQISEIRKALEAGEAEKRRREALARSASADGEQSRRGRRGGDAEAESMEDYFGKKGQDFGAMLKSYDWGKAPAKDEDGESRRRRPK
ncbi:MAG: endonuclease domain-containing protein [Bacillota bacterium]